MRDSWDERVERATELAQRDDPTRALLQTYSRLLALQRDAYETLRRSAAPLTGSLTRDLPRMRPSLLHMLAEIASLTPSAVAEEAQRLLHDEPAAIESLLIRGWHDLQGHPFVPKLILQPYASCLVTAAVQPVDRDASQRKFACPFCGGAPQLSILERAATAEGGGRQLQCATCLSIWPFRRVVCANCGEEDERRLGYFHADGFDHVRIDSCDTCGHYLKSVDLTRLGTAVPLVDEVAAAALDLWATEHGYQKVELNLMGV